MKLTTTVHAKFESKGKPESTEVTTGTIREIAIGFTKWLMQVHMGSHIKCTLARTALELEQHTTNKFAAVSDSDIMADLDALLDQDILPLHEER